MIQVNIQRNSQSQGNRVSFTSFSIVKTIFDCVGAQPPAPCVMPGFARAGTKSVPTLQKYTRLVDKYCITKIVCVYYSYLKVDYETKSVPNSRYGLL